MEEHFNTLKNSKLPFDTSIFNQVAKTVGQKDFVVKVFLAWSLNHQFEKPTKVEMYPDRQSNIYIYICVCMPSMKIYFLSVDPYNRYYLQVWKNDISSSKTLQNPELVRVKYGNMRICPGSIIHEGGFENLESKGNFRIQLHIFGRFHSRAYFKNHYYNEYKYNNVTKDQLKLYRFEQGTKISSEKK